MVNFSPNRGSGMTLEAFARAYDLPTRWLELREACEEIVHVMNDFTLPPTVERKVSGIDSKPGNPGRN